MNDDTQFIPPQPDPPQTAGQGVDRAVSGVADLGEQGLGKLRDAFHVPAKPGSNGIAIAGMVLGIVAMTIGFWMTGFIEIPAGITGLVLSCVALGRANKGAPGKGFAITGLVLTVVAAPLYLMALILSAGLWFLV